MTKKEKNIRDLLKRLTLDEKNWIIVDHWDGDQCAIGIAHRRNPERLVYISTYNKKPGYYDYECEIPTNLEENECLSLKAGGNVSYAEILNILKLHLN